MGYTNDLALGRARPADGTNGTLQPGVCAIFPEGAIAQTIALVCALSGLAEAFLHGLLVIRMDVAKGIRACKLGGGVAERLQARGVGKEVLAAEIADRDEIFHGIKDGLVACLCLLQLF